MRIVNFYSYKGGVGRTNLLVNVADYMCQHHQKRILLMEWDLEAPGLHIYYEVGVGKLKSTQNSLIDILTSYLDNASRLKGQIDTDKYSYLQYFTDEELSACVDIENCIIPNISKPDKGGNIDLCIAGPYHIKEGEDSYYNKITKINWDEYRDLQGSTHIEYLKQVLHEKLESKYDFIFIDSRTGIPEYGGYCITQLPDINVMVAAPNKENFQGIEDAINRFLASPYVKNGERHYDKKEIVKDNIFPIILPILSRVDIDIKGRNFNWLTEFYTRFSPYLVNGIKNRALEINRESEVNEEEFFSNYTQNILLEHDKTIAAGENRIFVQNDNNKYDKYIPKVGLGKQIKNIAEMLLEIDPRTKYLSRLSEIITNPSLSLDVLEYALKHQIFYYLLSNQKGMDLSLLKRWYDLTVEQKIDKGKPSLFIEWINQIKQSDSFKEVVDSKHKHVLKIIDAVFKGLNKEYAVAIDILTKLLHEPNYEGNYFMDDLLKSLLGSEKQAQDIDSDSKSSSNLDRKNYEKGVLVWADNSGDRYFYAAHIIGENPDTENPKKWRVRYLFNGESEYLEDKNIEPWNVYEGMKVGYRSEKIKVIYKDKVEISEDANSIPNKYKDSVTVGITDFSHGGTLSLVKDEQNHFYLEVIGKNKKTHLEEKLLLDYSDIRMGKDDIQKKIIEIE